MSQNALRAGAILKPPGGTDALAYRIEGLLGEGGFGITYLAEWMGTQVAIKEYLPEEFAYRSHDGISVLPRTGHAAEMYQFGLVRFEQEARTLLQFKSEPSVVRALNYFEGNGTAYLVMDYLVGRTLEQLLHDRGALPEDQLRPMLRSCLHALGVIHRRGYLHRDIKPANILIVTDGRPVLLDFGAARQALSEKTQSLTVILSPGYAPVEQYNTSGSGPFTDLYALGACVYRAMLTETPDAASARMRCAQAPNRVVATQRGEPDPLAEASKIGARRYTPAFLDLIDWMLKIWPAERPETAEDVLRRLNGAPTTIHAVTPTSQLPVDREETAVTSVRHATDLTPAIHEGSPRKNLSLLFVVATLLLIGVLLALRSLSTREPLQAVEQPAPLNAEPPKQTTPNVAEQTPAEKDLSRQSWSLRDYINALREASDAVERRTLKENARALLAKDLDFGSISWEISAIGMNGTSKEDRGTYKATFVSYSPSENELQIYLRKSKGGGIPGETCDPCEFEGTVTLLINRMDMVFAPDGFRYGFGLTGQNLIRVETAKTNCGTKLCGSIDEDGYAHLAFGYNPQPSAIRFARALQTILNEIDGRPTG